MHERTAINIVKYRDEKGRFQSRVQLKEVPGIGPKTFEQAAGFLRIRNADNPLDATAVHPESYHIVEQIAQSLNLPIEELIKNPQLLEKLDRSQLSAGTYTLNDILEELRKPGRDPRDKFVAPSFNEQVREISDVQPGMVLEGVVTNVTKFGAFVDIGVHQDGLVHISELSNRYVKDPSDVGEGRPDRKGESAERRCKNQAHCAIHESPSGSAVKDATEAVFARHPRWPTNLHCCLRSGRCDRNWNVREWNSNDE